MNSITRPISVVPVLPHGGTVSAATYQQLTSSAVSLANRAALGASSSPLVSLPPQPSTNSTAQTTTKEWDPLSNIQSIEHVVRYANVFAGNTASRNAFVSSSSAASPSASSTLATLATTPPPLLLTPTSLLVLPPSIQSLVQVLFIPPTLSASSSNLPSASLPSSLATDSSTSSSAFFPPAAAKLAAVTASPSSTITTTNRTAAATTQQSSSSSSSSSTTATTTIPEPLPIARPAPAFLILPQFDWSLSHPPLTDADQTSTSPEEEMGTANKIADLLQRVGTPLLAQDDTVLCMRLLATLTWPSSLLEIANVTALRVTPSIVEENPQLAAACITAALRICPRDQSSPFLQELLDVETSLRGLEVVNLLASSCANGGRGGGGQNSNTSTTTTSLRTNGNNNNSSSSSTSSTTTNNNHNNDKKSLLPRDFLPLYVGNALAQCESLGRRDKFAQNRLVRLVCVLVQALLAAGTLTLWPPPPPSSSSSSSSPSSSLLSPQSRPNTGASSMWEKEEDETLFGPLLAHLESFCVEFSRIKEATLLYKVLKLRGGDTV